MGRFGNLDGQSRKEACRIGDTGGERKEERVEDKKKE